MLGSRNIRLTDVRRVLLGLRRPSAVRRGGGAPRSSGSCPRGPPAVTPASAASAPVFVNQAPDGQGLNVTPGDLKFILKQIKIAERHAATLTRGQPLRHAGRPGPGRRSRTA